MNNEIKHYNHNHGKDGRFTFGSGGGGVVFHLLNHMIVM